MTKRKINSAKIVCLVLLCVGITFFSVNNSQAIPIDVTGITATGPVVADVPWYTQYWLQTVEFGELDAFCVELQNAFPVQDYVLVPAPTSGLVADAAGIASQYFSGRVLTSTGATTQEEAKVATQLAIWQHLGFAATTDAIYSARVSEVLALDFSSISNSIRLAQSPVDGSVGPGQDYLVSVPDASIMFLLGPALLGLGLLGRRKSKK